MQRGCCLTVILIYCEQGKTTMTTFLRNTTTLNGNRYSVIKYGDIPSNVVVFNSATHQEVSFHARYKGQKCWCRPKWERQKKMLDNKILSECTLHQAEIDGLTAGILCMSDSRIGHLANTLQDDPDLSERYWNLLGGVMIVVTPLTRVKRNMFS